MDTPALIEEEVIEPTVVIAHLSDFIFDGAGGADAAMAKRALAKRPVREVDLVVVTGNLTNNGSKLALEAASSFLRPVAKKALVVPGANDLPPHPEAGVRPADDWLEAFPGPGDEADQWPRKVSLEGGQCVVFGLNSTRINAERTAIEIGRIGFDQLERLDAMLRALEPNQRRVVVLHHRVKALGLGKGKGNEVEDAERLLRICNDHSVDLILHGGKGGFLRRKANGITSLGAPSLTGGCAATGQRFVPLITLGLATGTVSVERVQFARPANRPDLDAVYDTAEAMEAYTRLAETAYEAEDSFAVFATELRERVERLGVIDAASADLDKQIEKLLHTPGSPPTTGPLLSTPNPPALPHRGDGDEQ